MLFLIRVVKQWPYNRVVYDFFSILLLLTNSSVNKLEGCMLCLLGGQC